jgi:hypothetical protein
MKSRFGCGLPVTGPLTLTAYALMIGEYQVEAAVLYSAFVQDQISLAESVWFMIGTTFEWARLSPHESIEFSVTGQSLLTARRAELSDAYGIGHTQVPRSAPGKITWKF